MVLLGHNGLKTCFNDSGTIREKVVLIEGSVSIRYGDSTRESKLTEYFLLMYYPPIDHAIIKIYFEPERMRVVMDNLFLSYQILFWPSQTNVCDTTHLACN